jgi:hypothetical protein
MVVRMAIMVMTGMNEATGVTALDAGNILKSSPAPKKAGLFFKRLHQFDGGRWGDSVFA